MLTAADLQIADSILAHQLDLFRLEAHTRAQALELLDRLGSELEARLRQSDLTAYSREATTRLLAQTTEVIDRYYTALQTHSEATLSGMAQVQSNVIKQAIDASLLVNLDASVPTTAYLNRLLSTTLIEGAQSGAWWAKQSADTAFKFSAAVRQGMAAGETNAAILTRIVGTKAAPGILDIAKSNARTLIHASIQSVANAARRDTFQQNRDIIKGIRQVSTFDSHTTEICIAYNGCEWDLDYEPINGTLLPYNGGVPRHWGCRSVEVPITKTFRELGLNIPEVAPGQRASAQGPVAANMTMDAFLKRQGKAAVEEQLGVGRAEMWRSGKITLRQLVDLRGNPLTLKALQRKYG